jgi:uncharacterized protein YjiS (DUF1127 family)
MNTQPWFASLRRWLQSQRELNEFSRLSPRERRDLGITEYDIRWSQRRR